MLFRSSSLTRTFRTFSTNPSNKIFQLGKLNHVAIAVPNLQQAAAFYRDTLGASVTDPEDLPEHGVTTIFVNLPNTKFELLHPYGENSPIANFLKKNTNGGIHHVCLEVEDIEQAVQQVKKMNVRVLGDVKIGAHGKPVIFLHPKDCNGVLVELEQV
uniref:Methylmalonyl-CoA epimerase, mitochondrial n=1 Tax=Percolomonas cosmopolitus TaxID=63605 RepID=A0A7S1KUR1_9EUKA